MFLARVAQILEGVSAVVGTAAACSKVWFAGFSTSLSAAALTYSRIWGRCKKKRSAPLGLLQCDTIAIGILEGLPADVPIRVERLHELVAAADYALNSLLLFGGIGQIEHQEIVLGRRTARLVPMSVRELEVMLRARLAQHDAFETVVTLQRAEELQFRAAYWRR